MRLQTPAVGRLQLHCGRWPNKPARGRLNVTGIELGTATITHIIQVYSPVRLFIVMLCEFIFWKKGSSPITTVDKVPKAPVTSDLPSIYGSTSAGRSAEASARHGAVVPPPPDRYPPVAALAGEQLLARSGFQPYRPDDR